MVKEVTLFLAKIGTGKIREAVCMAKRMRVIFPKMRNCPLEREREREIDPWRGEWMIVEDSNVMSE